MNPITITIVKPDGSIATREVDRGDEAVTIAIMEILGVDAMIDKDPFLTLYQGRAVAAYVDDEALLNGAPANRLATSWRTGPGLPVEPIHGTVVIVPV